MTAKLELINLATGNDEIRCALCKKTFRSRNGPWPAVPVEGKEGHFKVVCLDCASVEEPAKDYGTDWQDILDGIAMGRFAKPEVQARAEALAALEEERSRRAHWS